MISTSAFAETVARCWSPRSATTFREDNPALGQCSVTALVAQDQLGGVILRTRVGGAWHFYNMIDGRRLDFTASQFPQPIHYDDLPADRDDAFADTAVAQYEALSAVFACEL